MKYYLIELWGCVEPHVVGKFNSRKKRDEFAKEFHAGKDFNGESDVLIYLDVNARQNIFVGAYQAGFFEEDEDE